MLSRKICLLICFCLLHGYTPAQFPDYHLRKINKQNGLKTADVVSITKDTDNYLWVATQTSVQKFDGVNTQTFYFNEIILQVLCDSGNNKWVITRQGIYKFINNYKGFEACFADKLNKERPRQMVLFNAAVILLTNNGVYQFANSKTSLSKLSIHGLNEQNVISHIAGIKGNCIFFWTNDSLFKYNFQSQKKKAISYKNIFNVTVLNEEELIVSDTKFSSKFISFSEKNFVNASNNIGRVLGKSIVFNHVEITSQKILLASTNGFFVYDVITRNVKPIQFYASGKSLENPATCKLLYKDKSGTIFLDNADGLYYFDPDYSPINYIRQYCFNKICFEESDIRNFTEDNNGNIWLASTKGVYTLNMNSGALQKVKLSFDESQIDFPSYRQLFFLDNNVWIGSSGNGIWMYDPLTKQSRRPSFDATPEGSVLQQKVNSAYIWKLLKINSSDVLVFTNSGCFIINSTTFYCKEVIFETSNISSRSAYIDSKQHIWHGTTNGLSCVDQNFKTLFRIKDSFPDKRIASFCEISANEMLVGTKGLYRIVTNGTTIKHFERVKEIPENRFIYCMQKDRKGLIWLGTDEGIICYNSKTRVVKYFTEEDNVQPQAFNSDGAFITKNGMLLMGGKNGFNYFYPGQIRYPDEPLEPGISSFRFNNNDSAFYLQQQPLRIRFSEAENITFSINAPRFRNLNNLQYKFRFRSDSTWNVLGNNYVITLNSLSAGNYFLEVAVSADGKNWEHSTKPFHFLILKPWYQQGWFLVLATMLLLICLYWMYKGAKRYIQINRNKEAIAYFAQSSYERAAVDDMLWDICYKCISRIGLEECVIYVVDEERQVLIQKAAYGNKSNSFRQINNPIEIPIGKGITGFVAQTGIAEIVKNTKKDKRYIVDDAMRLSEICVPVVYENKVIALIDSEHPTRNFFTKLHLTTLQQIAFLCASKISDGLAKEALQKAQTRLHELNNKMNELKLSNLRLQMNPHFLFNALSSIQYLIVTKETNKAYKYLSVFSRYLRSLLLYSDKTLISISEELTVLDMHLQLENIGIDHQVNYEFTIDESIEPDEVFIPPFIIQPFIENAVWHGLMLKEGIKKLDIKMTLKEDSIICAITDNGIGRQKAMLQKRLNLSAQNHQSKAIEIIIKRLQLLQNQTGKPASVTINDLMQNDEPAGTEVILVIPSFNEDDL